MRRSVEAGDRMAFDTGTYMIEAQGHWASAHRVGSVSMSGDGLSPASAWVHGALRALEPCWSATDPTSR